MLTIKELKAKIGNKDILHGLNLEIKPGEVHAIMGPNGSGKSTLANVLAGNDVCSVTSGEVIFKGQDLLSLKVEDRACLGLFLGLQNPVEIEGVNNLYFLKAALNSIRKRRDEGELDAFDFTILVKEKMKILGLNETFLQRSLNYGFSGGEKKKNEILQMLVLEPSLIVLDEIDSGLDIDALQIVSKGINSLRDKNRSILMITHYQRLLNYVVPDYVHVFLNGKIIASGDEELALKLEQEGYGLFGI